MEKEFLEWYKANEKRFAHGQFSDKDIAYSAWLECRNVNDVKVYQTNAALGYRQLAYLIKLKNNDYLCIGTLNVVDYSYNVGDVVKDLEDYYLEQTDYKLEDSPLFGTFLFDYYIKN